MHLLGLARVRVVSAVSDEITNTDAAPAELEAQLNARRDSFPRLPSPHHKRPRLVARTVVPSGENATPTRLVPASTRDCFAVGRDAHKAAAAVQACGNIDAAVCARAPGPEGGQGRDTSTRVSPLGSMAQMAVVGRERRSGDEERVRFDSRPGDRRRRWVRAWRAQRSCDSVSILKMVPLRSPT